MPSTRGSLILVGFVLISSVGASVPADTAGSARGCFPTIDEAPTAAAVGDVVSVEMLLCFSGSVTVDGPGYEGTVSLESDDYSGGVVVRVNTRESGASALSVTAQTFPNASLSADVTGDGTFAAGTYEVTVRDGTGDVADRTNVTLSEQPVTATQTQTTTTTPTQTTTAPDVHTETKRSGTASRRETSTTATGFRAVGALLSLLAATSLLARR